MKDLKDGSAAGTFGDKGIEAVRAFVLGISILMIIVVASIVFVVARGGL